MANGDDEREDRQQQAPAVFDPSLYGTPGARVEAAEAATLEGRNVDMGPFGDPLRDPAATATQMYEFARTGDSPIYETLEMAREGSGFPTEFPMAPGTSRASRELPEFFGDFEIDPEGTWTESRQQMMQVHQDPEANWLSRMGAGMYLSGGPMGPALPPVRPRASGMGAGLGDDEKLMIIAAGLTMYDPSEFAQVLLQTDEEGNRRFPQYSINQAPDGAYVVTNSINGAKAVINRPGMSTLDMAQAVTAGAAFTPAGRITAAVPSVMGRIIVGGSTAAGTEALIQAGHEQMGGEFDPEDVVITGAIGPVVDLARPLMGGIQRFGRYIGSYIPEDLGAKFGLKTGPASVLDEADVAVRDWLKNSKDWLESNRRAVYMTEDALPEIHTPRIKILLKIAERMIFPGTGGLRKKQAAQRVEALRHLADRFDLDPATNFGETVLRDLNRTSGDALETALRGRAQAVEDLGNVDIVLRDFRLKIRDLIEAESAYGPMANQAVIDLLNKARTAVWQGGISRPGPMPRDFGLMDDWLQRLRMHASDSTAPLQARDAMRQAADALESDLRRHAGDAGEAGAAWLRNMDDAAAAASQAERRTLDALIERGEVDQQVLRRIIRNGDEAQMRTLYEAMTPAGREAAKQEFLRGVLRVGGWRRAPAKELKVDVNRVVQSLETDAAEAQIRAFFPEPEDQQMFYGLIEYLKRTADAQRVGQGTGIASSGGLKSMAGANAINLLTAGLYGGGARLWQSGVLREPLLRLYRAGSDRRMIDSAMKELTGVLMAAGQQYMQEQIKEDPQTVILSGAAQDAMNEQSDFDLMMQTLRSVTGQEEAEQQEAADRLQEMQQEMNQ